MIARLRTPLAPVVVLRGPRQVGKTTLQQQVIDQLLLDGVPPKHLLRVQFDALPSVGKLGRDSESILRIVQWYEQAVLGESINTVARRGTRAFLFFDEVQNLAAWDVQLKSLVDHATVSAFVTGSSALRIEKGRDSLAGRIQSFDIGSLRLFEIAALRGIGTLQPMQHDNGWADWGRPDFWTDLHAHALRQAPTRDETFRAFSERGAYPFVHLAANVSWPEIADQLTETVVKRVIQHDLRVGERGRKRDPQLLEEVFRMACRYAGQAPNPATLATEAHLQLGASIGGQRVKHYLDFLDSSLLIRTLKPLEIRLKKRKGFDKLCLCDHALRAAWLQEVVPLDTAALDANPHLTDLAGRIADSTVGYFLSTMGGLDVSHRPEQGAEPEIDFVISTGDQRIPVEVKYRRRIDGGGDTVGLRSFLEKTANNATFGILVTRDDESNVSDPRIVCVPLKSFLMVR